MEPPKFTEISFIGDQSDLWVDFNKKPTRFSDNDKRPTSRNKRMMSSLFGHRSLTGQQSNCTMWRDVAGWDRAEYPLCEDVVNKIPVLHTAPAIKCDK